MFSLLLLAPSAMADDIDRASVQHDRMRMTTQEDCNDGKDNDGDGWIDGEDEDSCKPGDGGFYPKSIADKTEAIEKPLTHCIRSTRSQVCGVGPDPRHFTGTTTTEGNVIPMRDFWMVTTEDGRYTLGGGGALGAEMFVVDSDPERVGYVLETGDGFVESGMFTPRGFGQQGLMVQINDQGEFGTHLVVSDAETNSAFSVPFGTIGIPTGLSDQSVKPKR